VAEVDGQVFLSLYLHHVCACSFSPNNSYCQTQSQRAGKYTLPLLGTVCDVTGQESWEEGGMKNLRPSLPNTYPFALISFYLSTCPSLGEFCKKHLAVVHFCN
jgi:hypothetical protein